MHRQVVQQRFRDEKHWHWHGCSPILLPQIEDLPWQAVAGLPCDKNASRIRTVLHEVEQKTTAEATARGDVEATVNRADRQRLAGAVDRLGLIPLWRLSVPPTTP